MFDQLKSKKIDVAISRGNNPEESVLNSIENLGGITKFINEGDQVFIKFNLSLPGGFPINTNPKVLGTVISSCKAAGAKKILIGSFPLKRLPLKIIYEYLDIQKFIENLGAELVYLDNSDFFNKKEIKQEDLKKIKKESFSVIKLSSKEVIIPKLILDSDKFIIINQVNVNPLFKVNLALLSSYSIVPTIQQEIKNISQSGKDFLSIDKYRRDLNARILDLYEIKQPDLVINDMFYILEGAGPYIYRDSNLIKTGLIIAGKNGIAVDLITLKVLNEEIDKKFIIEAKSRNLNVPNLSSIKIHGEKIENINIKIHLCESNLENIRVLNFDVKTGRYCSGCFLQAYHFLNLMKTYMVKDLKYNPYNSCLIGEDPTEPVNLGNIILFGACSINSTKNHKFRKVTISKKKKIKKEAKRKNFKEKKDAEEVIIKEKANKRILELPGCPPSIFDCLELMVKYYGKKNVPNLNLFNKINRIFIPKKIYKTFKLWEAL
ncbi:hypothetical protein LCGC14_0546910 [marine sediment metagenome]|uniref:DUF362 domain-containing protein n=1 Tax=marine sediment metagenome TaxID=412755 RepID=A0A0F9RR49_9ZZZZ